MYPSPGQGGGRARESVTERERDRERARQRESPQCRDTPETTNHKSRRRNGARDNAGGLLSGHAKWRASDVACESQKHLGTGFCGTSRETYMPMYLPSAISAVPALYMEDSSNRGNPPACVPIPNEKRGCGRARAPNDEARGTGRVWSRGEGALGNKHHRFCPPRWLHLASPGPDQPPGSSATGLLETERTIPAPRGRPRPSGQGSSSSSSSSSNVGRPDAASPESTAVRLTDSGGQPAAHAPAIVLCRCCSSRRRHLKTAAGYLFPWRPSLVSQPSMQIVSSWRPFPRVNGTTAAATRLRIRQPVLRQGSQIRPPAALRIPAYSDRRACQPPIKGPTPRSRGPLHPANTAHAIRLLRHFSPPESGHPPPPFWLPPPVQTARPTASGTLLLLGSSLMARMGLYSRR